MWNVMQINARIKTIKQLQDLPGYILKKRNSCVGNDSCLCNSPDVNVVNMYILKCLFLDTLCNQFNEKEFKQNRQQYFFAPIGCVLVLAFSHECVMTHPSRCAPLPPVTSGFASSHQQHSAERGRAKKRGKRPEK